MASRKAEAVALAQVALALFEISDPKAPPLALGRKAHIRRVATAMVEKAQALVATPAIEAADV